MGSAALGKFRIDDTSGEGAGHGREGHLCPGAQQVKPLLQDEACGWPSAPGGNPRIPPGPAAAGVRVLLLSVVCWAMWYAAGSWSPEPCFANAPTFRKLVPPAPAARSPAASAAPAIEKTPLGEQVFGNKCAACHQPDGAGVPGLFPSLRGNPVVLNPDATEQIHIILTGLHGKEIGGVTYASEMPAFGDQLDDPRVAAVINHTRTSWGNRAPTINAADVAKVRAGAQ